MKQTSDNKTSLAVFFLFTLLAVSTLTAETTPIVLESDPAYVSHTLKVKNVTIDLNDKGGGYLNYCSIDDGANIVSTDYGKGWQGALRDRMHRGRYNPTQAGFTDTAGTPVDIQKIDKKLIIPKFNMPLFGDAVFDFTQYEDLVPDSPKYRDGGNTDTDGYTEEGWTQDDEIRSEFDFQGYYEDASHLADNQSVVIRFYAEYIYAREPKAIYQFGKKARKSNGQPVLHEKGKSKDISKTLVGNQEPTPTDLSHILFVPYGVRLTKASGYKIPMWYDNGQWHYSSLKELKGKKKKKKFSMDISQAKLKSDFLLFSTGKNPDTSSAIALYVPESEINHHQLVGINRLTNKIAYKEDRRSEATIFFTHRTPKQMSMRYIYTLSGMLGPHHTEENISETIRNETYILFGSPNEILKSILLLEKL